MNYRTIKDMAERWNVTPRRVQMMCANGEIDGAIKLGRDWLIPDSAVRPADGRRKA